MPVVIPAVNTNRHRFQLQNGENFMNRFLKSTTAKMKGDLEGNKCMICREVLSKYRCPSCHIRYCSVACFKKHKEELCETETNRRKEEDEEERIFKTAAAKSQELEEGEVSDSDLSGDEDKLSEQELSRLGNSELIKGMLSNKHLRDMIKDIDSHPNPDEILLRDAMQKPVFAEFVDQCLAVVQPNERTKAVNGNW